MSLPISQEIRMPYGDIKTLVFQLLEDNNPVSDDLNAQTITLYIRGDATFTPIDKDIATESWILDNTLKKFQVVIDTSTYKMVVGSYQAEIEWEDKGASLVYMNISVYEDITH